MECPFIFLSQYCVQNNVWRGLLPDKFELRPINKNITLRRLCEWEQWTSLIRTYRLSPNFHMYGLLFPLMSNLQPLIQYWFWFTDSLNTTTTATTTTTTTDEEKTLTLCFQWKCTFLKEAFKSRKGIYGQFNFDVKWKKYVFAIVSYFFCFNQKIA